MTSVQQIPREVLERSARALWEAEAPRRVDEPDDAWVLRWSRECGAYVVSALTVLNAATELDDWTSFQPAPVAAEKVPLVRVRAGDEIQFIGPPDSEPEPGGWYRVVAVDDDGVVYEHPGQSEPVRVRKRVTSNRVWRRRVTG